VVGTVGADVEHLEHPSTLDPVTGRPTPVTGPTRPGRPRHPEVDGILEEGDVAGQRATSG